DLVDREAVDQLVAQQRAVARGQLFERGAERVGELGAVLRLELLERGVIAVARIDDEMLFERRRPLLRLRDAHELARYRHAQPATQGATAGVVTDRGGPTFARDEQLRPDDLRRLVAHRRVHAGAVGGKAGLADEDRVAVGD